MASKEKLPAKRGAPGHQRTEANAQTVLGMASVGTPQEDIATIIGVSAPTLRKHYAHELAIASIRANAQCGNTLYQVANGRPAEYAKDKEGNILFNSKGDPVVIRSEILPNPASLMFWMKCRAGWKEVQHVEHSGLDVGSMKLTQDQARDILETYNDEEREAVRKFLAALRAAKPIEQTAEEE